MVISSTCYAHKNIHKATWTSPGGTTNNQIDHVIVDNQIKHWIQDVRSCRGVGLHSDHFLVRAIVRVKLPREWTAKLSTTKKLNLESLKEEQTWKKYQDEIIK